MKKVLAFAMAALMASALFVGCGSDPAATSGSGEAPSNTDTNKITITQPSDLDGLKIGVQGGTTGESYVQDNVKDAKLSSFNSGMDAALDLKNGGVDAVVLDELPAKAIVEQNPDLTIVDVGLSKEDYAIAVKKGNKELLDSINKTIKRIKEDGTYQKLTDAFMPSDGKIIIPETKLTAGSKILKMGTNAAFKPFEYVDGTEPVGFDVSLSQEIAADYGAKLQVEDMKFDSLISALTTGQVDFVAAGMTVNPERLENVDFSDSYYTSNQVVIIKK